MEKSSRKYIADILKKKNLVDFIEKEARVSFNKMGDRSVCICPMPSHRDSKPSFGVGEGPDGVWLYNCFGCGSGGTIIDFVIDFYGAESFVEAIAILMTKFEISSDVELVSKAIKDAKVTMDMKNELECEHIQAASACRSLLRKKTDKATQSWVGSSYRKMNALLKVMDKKGIVKIKQEAVKRLV
ncbi:MAG: CHC2 zinc finger domain-containing protein [Candidatus Cloacimonetes bacterium]|jgi:DNA primase|nr:CHC2 zinc finger domain-containing protein [Candidatus Cloacimonadota bacterium]